MLTGGADVRRCAVLGSPIAHSLSPVLHRAAYRELGLAWRYDAVEVDAAGLPGFLSGLGAGWRGLSLTMPLKRAVLPLLSAVSEPARRADAANTVLLEDDGGRTGHNTDIPGIERALAERGVLGVHSAVVVGGGATATSALLALAALGCKEVTLCVRDPRRAAGVLEARDRLDDPPRVRVRRLDDAEGAGGAVDLVLSTVPVHAQTAAVTALAAGAQVVFDVVYDPWPTPLAQLAGERGALVLDGLDLLVHQATLQVELMTGRAPAPLAAMRAAGRAALARTETR